MSSWINKRLNTLSAVNTLIIIALLFTGSCKNFINLELIGFTLYPGTDNTILPGEKTVLSIRFNTAMDQLITQKAVSVHFLGGFVNGDLLWQGNELRFVPLESWLPGIRYTLNMEGVILARDGREDRVKKHIAFYALTRESGPYAVYYTPQDGFSTGVNADEGAYVKIVFSQPMDRQSTIDAFNIDGTGERDFIWLENDTVMEFRPKTNLQPWTVYRWNLSTKAKGINGIPLGREISGHFITDADRILPIVTEVFPLSKGSAELGLWWIKTNAAMENGLGSGQAIGIEFNKEMDESVLRNVRFDPPLAGRSEMWKPNTLVFIPDRDPEPERIYTLFVSADSRDTNGLRMEKEFSLVFTADIPYLNILSLNTGSQDSSTALTVPVHNGIYPAASIQPEGIITISLRFSHGIDPRAQADIVLALRMETFFPGTLRPISFRSARWWSADTVILQWEGIQQSSSTEKHFYRLILPGGRSGISDGKGSYLQQDMTIYFEIEP